MLWISIHLGPQPLRNHVIAVSSSQSVPPLCIIISVLGSFGIVWMKVERVGGSDKDKDIDKTDSIRQTV